MLTATQRYKVEEIPKAIYLPIVFSNPTKADAVGQGDCLISFGLPAWRLFLFYSSPPSLPQKQSFMDFFFSPLGFCKFNCFEKTDVA